MQRSSFLLIMGLSLFLYCKGSAERKMPENKEQLLETDLKQCQDENQELGQQRSVLENQNKELEGKVADLSKQIAYLKEHNTATLKHLESMSVISSAQADSIRKSLDSLGAKDAYIQNIQEFMAKKDAMNMNLVLNLKGALGNEPAEEIEIKVDKGVVFIDISDKMLFKSGSHELTSGAKAILGKVARVLKEQPGMEIMVEGHTDNVPYTAGVLRDNWDLSVKRSTAIVRVLQNSYGVSPSRLIAAGRGEYKPIASNEAAAGRASNRRTRIAILPELDQFFQLLEPKSQ